MTLSYTAVTVAALLVVEIVLFAASFGRLALQLESGYLPGRMFDALAAGYAPQLAPFVSSADRAGLQGWLDHLESARIGVPLTGQIPLLFDPGDLQMMVLDRDGRELAATGAADDSARTLFDLDALADSPAPGPGGSDSDRFYRRSGGHIHLAVPIPKRGDPDEMLGLLLVSTAGITPAILFGEFARLLGISLVLFTLVAGVVGTGFGFLASRPLARRIGRLADTAQRWSGGAFASRVADRERDELGWLAHRLDQMAERLGELVEQSGQLAATEERNRLARELHDSVKQQAFAASAQIAAARASLAGDAARGHLDEAGRIVDELRRELTGLIGDSGPILLDDSDLAAALERHGADWSRRSGIALAVEAGGGPRLPSGVERALFRIVQEALANVERHSGASAVHIVLDIDPEGVSCTICDDGRGFDPGSDETGFGVRSMRERAAEVGGYLALAPGPQGGICISVTAPRHRDAREPGG